MPLVTGVSSPSHGFFFAGLCALRGIFLYSGNSVLQLDIGVIIEAKAGKCKGTHCSIFLLMRLAQEYSPLDCRICLYRNVPSPLLGILSDLCGLFLNVTAKHAESTKSLKRKSLSSSPSPLLCVLSGLCGLFFNVTAKHAENAEGFISTFWFCV